MFNKLLSYITNIIYCISGLIRASIAAPPSSSPDAKKKGLTTNMKTILNEVSGTAAPGEILALMGPSGSGKVRLLLCIGTSCELQNHLTSMLCSFPTRRPCLTYSPGGLHTMGGPSH